MFTVIDPITLINLLAFTVVTIIMILIFEVPTQGHDTMLN